MDESSAQGVSDELDRLMARIARTEDPYSLGIEAMGAVVDAIPHSLIASHVYRLWGELTDRYELKPEKRFETQGVMRCAAGEWPATKDDPIARDRYLDHWLDNVCGYERPT